MVKGCLLQIELEIVEVGSMQLFFIETALLHLSAF